MRRRREGIRIGPREIANPAAALEMITMEKSLGNSTDFAVTSWSSIRTAVERLDSTEKVEAAIPVLTKLMRDSRRSRDWWRTKRRVLESVMKVLHHVHNMELIVPLITDIADMEGTPSFNEEQCLRLIAVGLRTWKQDMYLRGVYICATRLVYMSPAFLKSELLQRWFAMHHTSIPDTFAVVMMRMRSAALKMLGPGSTAEQRERLVMDVARKLFDRINRSDHPLSPRDLGDVLSTFYDSLSVCLDEGRFIVELKYVKGENHEEEN